MKLTLVDTDSPYLPEKLDIDDARYKQLKLFVGLIAQKMESEAYRQFPLCERYKDIATYCANLEEYTYCMHIFIFYLARNGGLNSEPMFAN